MAENSGIEWTHHTFNPWWGCVRVSEACRHCYAETFAKRMGVEWGPAARRRFFGQKHWDEPLKWNARAEKAGERQRVFCASMADVFEQLPGEHPDWGTMETARMHLYRLIEKTPHLDWLLLTKRPENVLDMVPNWWWHELPENVWLGATVEDQEQAEKRIPGLLQIPARIRFLSCEPLLGRVDLFRWLWRYLPTSAIPSQAMNDGCAEAVEPAGVLHWVIAGGESGAGARPSNPDWYRSLRDQCTRAGVAFHFKQWGDLKPTSRGMDPRSAFSDFHGIEFERIGKKRAGRLLDGREWSEFPR